jgi:glycosyltransferase involved in cell wall biosynthesis
MRVAIDCRYVRERPSGIGEYVAAIARRVPELSPDDAFDLWRHPRARGPLSTAPNVRERVVRAEANGVASLLWPARLGDLARVDVLHLPSNQLGRGLGRDAATVVTVHDLMWLTAPSLASQPGVLAPIRRAYFAAGCRLALARATRLVAISRSTADEIAREAPGASARTVVIPHGVDARFTPAGDDTEAHARAAAALGFDAPYLLAVGQNAPFKGHDVALEAFAAGALARDVRLVFVQRLERSAALPRRARELGIAERVVFSGPLGEVALLDVLRGAMALVQASHVEGFGMPALEAMAAGVPVVASDAAALVEVCGGAALHARRGDVGGLAQAMRRVATEPSLRGDLRERGLERAKGFSWDRSAALHVEVYREAARGIM